MEDLNARVFAGYASFVLLIFSSISSAEAANIGVVINTNTRTGREQKVAIEIAAQHFNSSSSPLFLSFKSLSGIDDPLDLSTKAKELINWGADAIIGAVETWPEVATLAKAGNAARIPILSLAAAAMTTLSPSHLVQFSFPVSSEVRCLAELIRSYKWRRVIVIYEEDSYGSYAGVAALLSDALRASGSQIDHHIAFPPLHTISKATDLIRQKLKNIPPQLAKVFVVLRASPDLTFHLFKEAKGLSMMERDHVWILNDDATALIDSTLGHSFVSSYMQGVLGISTYFNTTTGSYRNFSSQFQRRLKREFKFEGEHHFEPGKYAVRAYDAVQGIAHAAATQAAKNTSMITLSEGILSSNFSGGLKGFISFSSFNGDGRVSSAFQVLNVVGRSYREIGFWVEGSGFYQNEMEMGRHGRGVDVLGSVIWPGGKVKTPGGWGKLRVGVPNHTTFGQFVNVEYDTTTWKVKSVTGFCIDVFKKIVASMDHDLVYEFIPFAGSYDDLVNQIPLKEADAAVGDITIVAKRSVNVTFTQPFLSSGLTMMVPIKPTTPWMLTKPFTKEVWSMILLTLIYTATVVWYLERDNNPKFDGAWPVQLGATIWLTFSTIFYCHERIYSYYTKTVIMVWLIVVLILTSSFTANLSSILTVEKIEPMPPGSRVGYNGAPFVLKYLEVLGYNNQSIVWIKKAEAYNEAFKSGNISAAYLETPYLRVFLSKYENYTVKGETHRLGGFGFAFPKDSPLAADFSEVIMKLTEDGTLKKLEKKWFSITLTISPGPKERTRDSLGLDCFWVLFVCSGCTSTLILVLFSVRSFFLNATTATTVSIERLRLRFKKIWMTSIAKLRRKESFRTEQSIINIDQ